MSVSGVTLTESFLAQAAGWQVMKEARSLLAADRVLSSDWSPPLLKGVVQAGPTAYRAGLVIKSPTDLENICTCRPSRDWGTICAHSVAVGLHHLRSQTPVAAPPTTSGKSSDATPGPARRLLRADTGAPAELCVILPPNFPDAAARGQVTLFFEARRDCGRVPLNALPRTQPFAFDARDAALLDALEALAGGDTPALLKLSTQDLVGLLPRLVDHPRITLGKSTAVTVTDAPWLVPLRASLSEDGRLTLRRGAQTASSPGGRPGATAGVPILLEGQWAFHDHVLQPVGLPKSCLATLDGPVCLPRERIPEFLIQDWPRLAAGEAVTVEFRLEDFVLEPLAPRFFLQLAGGMARLEAHLECAYGDQRLPPSAIGHGPSPSPNLHPSPSAASDRWFPDPTHPTRYFARDIPAEQAALAELLRAGFKALKAPGHCRLEGQEAVLAFFARVLPRLQRAWQVTLEERLERSTAQHLEPIEPRFQVTTSGVQWFEVEATFTSRSGERFSAADIQRLILSGRHHTRLRNGKTALVDTDALEAWQEALRDAAPVQQEGRYRVSHAQAGFLDATLRERCGWTVQAPAAWRERAATDRGAAPDQCPPLGPLQTVLRPYQKAGVAWLSFLRANGFGGILADEMGLGKTLQVLAFLQSRGCRRETAADPPDTGSRDGRALTSAATKEEQPCLVVCPTSLVFNWLAEAAKFTPHLRVLALHGPDRHAAFTRIPEHDLVVTSYALIRRDAERYRDLEFDTVILDEAQHIKNRQTENAQAVKSIRSRYRLVLTGTPLENSVLDLWSIFDFLMPGYLGSAQDFRDRYELPITRERNPAALERLARRLRPFILRRLKREVAPELPARLDQVAYCELGEEQRTVYQQVLEASRKEVLEAVGAQGLARSRMVVLTALLRLRQICCDLRLLNLGRTPDPTPRTSLSPQRGEGRGEGCDQPRGSSRAADPQLLTPALSSIEEEREGALGVETGQADGRVLRPKPGGVLHGPAGGALAEEDGRILPVAPSAKLELFSELLEEILDGGHRALVFSQFTRMLALLRERLETESIEFCYLDGSTLNRGEVVARFQEGNAPVFLISLKAGGVGLNLTGADTVIHFDPWWNPAVEDQATDRAHRIGQRRVVTSYKLITRGTVEEKILQLQQRKRDVIQATLGGEEQLAEALTWEEIQDLLAG